jgi:hypothetical protein
MTREKKGPPPRTPAQAHRSTDQDSVALCARDECIEQLRRVAEDAENFKVRLFHASNDSAVNEWRIVPERKSEWVRRAAGSISTYGEAIRATTRDLSAMAKQFNECWPQFRVHIYRLFVTIREIYDRASEGAASEDGGRMEPREAERAVQKTMAECELQIMRAVTGPFKRQVNSSRLQISDPQDVPTAVQPDAAGLSLTKQRHGPEANMQLHRTVAQIVASYGPKWRDYLDQIGDQLDKTPLSPPPKAWTRRTVPIRSWGRAVSSCPDLVIKRISYSLEMVKRDSQ